MIRATLRRIGAAAFAALLACAAHAQLGIGGPILGSTPVNWASPGCIGCTTPNSGVFTTLTAQTSFTLGSSSDIFLVRDAAAGIIAQRNGTNGQCFRVYNTFTDASNYERLQLCWAANSITIGTEKAGTGASRDLLFASTQHIVATAGGGGSIFLRPNNSSSPQVTVASALATVGMPLLVSTAATANQVRTAQTTAPTITTNGGTSPACVGTDTAMRCTIGTAPPAAATFTVTFNGTWGAAPSCVAMRGTTGASPLVQGLVTATTTVVVNLSANLVASEIFHIHCIGVA